MAVYDKNGRMIKSAKLKPNETHNVFEWQQIFNRAINFTNWIDKYYVDAAKFHKAMVRYYEMEDIDIAEYVSACLALIRDSNFKKDLLRLVKEHFHVDLEPITSSRKPIKSGIPFKNRGFNLTGHEIQDMEWRIDSGETVDYNGWTFVKDDDFDTIVATSPEGKTYDGFKSLSGFMDLYEYGSIESSRKPIKSVYDDRTGKDDYETKWEYVDELCDRAIKAMDGDRDAMFFNSHLNDNGFVIKGKYIDMIEDNHSSWGYGVPNDLWRDVCKSLAMDKLARITKATKRYKGQLEVDWIGNGLMNSLNRNENSLRAVFGK